LSVVRLLRTPVTVPFLSSPRARLCVFVSYLEPSTVYRMMTIVDAAFWLLKLFLPSRIWTLPLPHGLRLVGCPANTEMRLHPRDEKNESGCDGSRVDTVWSRRSV